MCGGVNAGLRSIACRESAGVRFGSRPLRGPRPSTLRPWHSSARDLTSRIDPEGPICRRRGLYNKMQVEGADARRPPRRRGLPQRELFGVQGSLSHRFHRAPPASTPSLPPLSKARQEKVAGVVLPSFPRSRRTWPVGRKVPCKRKLFVSCIWFKLGCWVPGRQHRASEARDLVLQVCCVGSAPPKVWPKSNAQTPGIGARLRPPAPFDAEEPTAEVSAGVGGM